MVMPWAKPETPLAKKSNINDCLFFNALLLNMFYVKAYSRNLLHASAKRDFIKINFTAKICIPNDNIEYWLCFNLKNSRN